jgi:hypothetical protein
MSPTSPQPRGPHVYGDTVLMRHLLKKHLPATDERSEGRHSTPALSPLCLAAPFALLPRTAIRVAGRPATCRVRRPRAFFHPTFSRAASPAGPANTPRQAPVWLVGHALDRYHDARRLPGEVPLPERLLYATGTGKARSGEGGSSCRFDRSAR